MRRMLSRVYSWGVLALFFASAAHAVTPELIFGIVPQQSATSLALV